ncbi:stellacyanin-like [Tripterygium wilfordii]|uniref:Stellacyanin-like n=1 Tax=Tripterygium wilfordii TaxID=458696 RepID=A0A7J7D9L1_TRIWF|nr:stellacyanin-like [Tripterygium wilfordii]
MASSRVFAVVFWFVAAIVSTSVLAKEFIVGDEAGWKRGVDYFAWAKDKDFRVGDKLVFQYPVGGDSFDVVYKVNETGFDECKPLPISGGLYSGNDIITFTTPGKRWYISDGGQEEGGNCMAGQKLAIYVKNKMHEGPYTGMAPTPIGS